LNRDQKAQRVAELKEHFEKVQFLALTDFTGLNVDQMTELRAKLKAAESQYQVVKNTIVRLAVKDSPAEKLIEHFVGPNGIVTAEGDVAGPAKALHEFMKENEKLVFKAGLLQGEPMTAQDFKVLATLPGREVLLGQLLGALNAVPTNFVSLLAAVPRNFLGVLKAIENQKAEAQA